MFRRILFLILVLTNVIHLTKAEIDRRYNQNNGVIDTEGNIKSIRNHLNKLRYSASPSSHSTTIDNINQLLNELSSISSSDADTGKRMRTMENTVSTLKSELVAKIDSGFDRLRSLEKTLEQVKGKLEALPQAFDHISSTQEVVWDIKSSLASTSKGSVGSGAGCNTDYIISSIDSSSKKLSEDIDALKLSTEASFSNFQRQVLKNLKVDSKGDGLEELDIDVAEEETKTSCSSAQSDSTEALLQELKSSQDEMKSELTNLKENIEKKMETCPVAERQNEASKGEQESHQRDAPQEKTEPEPEPEPKPEPRIYSAASTKEQVVCNNASHILSPRNCADLRSAGANCDGVYIIYPHGFRALRVYCDMTTEGGGWTVLMRRGGSLTRPLSFDHDWNGYKHGFGDVEDDFWIGNDYMHLITSQKEMSLMVNLTSFKGEDIQFQYSRFHVGPETSFYKLNVGTYTGPDPRSGNSFVRHNNQIFSTPDRNPAPKRANCALQHNAGWWFHSCYSIFLTGDYVADRTGYAVESTKGIRWPSWRIVPLKSAEMKVRPVGFGRY